MKALHFAIAYRTNGTKKGPAVAHVRYITRAQDGAEAHIGYVTRTTQTTREDLVATRYGNLPGWAGNDPAAFFAESDRWERVNGRTATQITAALPRALGHGEMIATVEIFLQSQLGRTHAYVWGIHETVASDGGRYPHVHIAFSERRDTGRGQSPQEYFSQKVNPKERRFHHREWPYAARQAWSDTLNVALEASGSPERVSARSIRDQGIDWQTAQYIDRQTLQRNKGLLHQRGPTEDTPEMLARRTQEWEARKRELGITRGMGLDEVVQRIGDASRARLNTPIEPQQRTRAVDLDEAHKATQDKLSQVRALRQAEEHYTRNPGQIRTPAHLAAVAKVLHEDNQDQGRVRRRRRWEREDEQERGGRMHGNGSAIVQERIIDILKASLGPCGELLEDNRLVELQVNDDGRVWVRWQGITRAQATPYRMSEVQRETVLRIVAGRMDLVCNALHPSLSTILPSGERFQGFRPPIAPGPGFVVRKPALKVFTLADYVQAGIVTAHQAELLRRAVWQQRNLLIGGGTLTGKTTFANALLAIMAEDGERIITLEDTPELQCPAPNTAHKYTKPGVKTMQELVQDVLREGPDRIVLGEVRGVEAVDLMDAWATGHPGGLCTVHAGSAAGVLPRMEQLMRRAHIPQEVAREMLGNAQPMIAYLERTPTGRVLKELVSVEGYANGAYQFGRKEDL